MRVLYLIRHARPVSPEGAQSDFDRPLSPVGRIEAEKIAAVLSAEQLTHPFVLSSPAARARETAEIVVATNHWSANFESRIYEAAPQTLLDVIGRIDSANEVVLLFGHNPGVEKLLRYFTGEIRAMPTAGVAKLELALDAWRDCADASARLEWLISP